MNFLRDDHTTKSKTIESKTMEYFSTPHLTESGVKLFASTWEKAKRRGLDLATLDLLGRNLGLCRYGERGTKVKFNPLCHKEVPCFSRKVPLVGPLPGDDAVIVDPGWANQPLGFKDGPVIVLTRADVTAGTFVSTEDKISLLENHGFNDFGSSKAAKIIQVYPYTYNYSIRDYKPFWGFFRCWAKVYTVEDEQWLLANGYTLSE
jgi:hypothetical protein